MKYFLRLAGVAWLALMAGCSSFPGASIELDELSGAKPSGSPFTQALSREYGAFAEAERSQGHPFNSQYFARKGLAASHGTVVAPENPVQRRVGEATVARDLASAAARLSAILTSAAPGRSPALTATAQVKFDCWVEQEDEGGTAAQQARCRKDCLAALAAIEAQIRAPASSPAATGTIGPSASGANSAAAAGTVKPTAADRYQVYFDFNRVDLSPQGARLIAEISAKARTAGYTRLTLIGFSDLSGPADYNLRLSLRRAETVRKAFLAAGWPADRLTVEARGKADPMVPTADGVREPQNRRVLVRGSR